MDAPDAGRIEALLASRRSLCALARDLVADSAAAEDAVQATLVVGLERGPREPRALGAWLRTVLRNEAWGRARAERRRTRREQAAARREALPSEEDLLERLDAARRVAEALAEPFRHTVLLRYFEDLTPSEIARRMMVPASTVRNRLRRAHAELRARLDREFGERAAWRRALLPLLGVPTLERGGGATSAATGIVMGLLATQQVALVVLVASLCAGILLFWPRQREGAAPPVAPDTAAAVNESAGEPGIAQTPSRRAEISTAAALPEPPRKVAVVSGRIACTDGRSLEGVRIYLWGGGRPGASIDAAGSFRIEAPWEMGTSLFLEYEGHNIALNATLRPRIGEETFVAVALDPGHEIELDVVAAEDGRPVPEAPVTLRRRDPTGQASAVFSRCDERGVLRCPLIPAGVYTVQIQHPDFTVLDERLEVPLAAPRTLRLDPRRPMHVVLNGYARYTPVKSVFLEMVSIPSPGDVNQTVRENAVPETDGSFTVNAPRPGRWRVEMFGSAGFPRVTQDLEIQPGLEPVRLEIALPERGAVRVHGRLLDIAGAPIGLGAISLESPPASVAADGAFALDAVVCGTRRIQWTIGKNNNRVEYDLGTREIPRHADDWEVLLTAPGSARLIVWIDGLSQEQLASDISARLEPLPTGEDRRSTWGCADAHKKLCFDYLGPGAYRVEVRWNLKLVETREVELRAGEPTEVEVRFAGSARIEIDLRTADGRPLPERILVRHARELASDYWHEILLVRDGRAVLELFHDFHGDVTLEAQGFIPRTLSLHAIPGRTDSIAVTLDPAE